MPGTQYNPAGVHGPDAVADALGVNGIEILRIIARGRINASQAPNGPRITEDVLRAYNDDGLIDLTSDCRLSVDGGGGQAWWPAEPALDVEMVRQECSGWLTNNPISQSRAAALAVENANDAFRVEVSPTGELVRILQAPVAVPKHIRRLVEDSPFKSAGEMYAVHHLRVITKRTIERSMRIVPALQRLYESPEAYAALTNDGYTALQKLGILVAHRFVVKAVPYNGPALQRGTDGATELPMDRSVSLIPGLEGFTKFFQVGRTRLAVALLGEGMKEPTPRPNDDTPREYRQRTVKIEHSMSFEAIATAAGLSKAKLIERAF